MTRHHVTSQYNPDRKEWFFTCVCRSKNCTEVQKVEARGK